MFLTPPCPHLLHALCFCCSCTPPTPTPAHTRSRARTHTHLRSRAPAVPVPGRLFPRWSRSPWSPVFRSPSSDLLWPLRKSSSPLSLTLHQGARHSLAANCICSGPPSPAAVSAPHGSDLVLVTGIPSVPGMQQAFNKCSLRQWIHA